MNAKKSGVLSRRRFVKLAGLAAAALAAAPAAAVAGTPTKPRAAGRPRGASRPAVKLTAAAAEFERQRKGTLDTLKTIRAFELPPGGEPAFTFTPVATTRRSGR